MMLRIVSTAFLAWIFGFFWFAFALPQPASEVATDAVIVPTGSAGRIPRGLDVLDSRLASQMLVTGVDPEVKPNEFAAEFNVSRRRMNCCVTLGFAAVDTRSNASETAKWLADNEFTSIRLVTADWHMRRAAHELDLVLPESVRIVRDAVPSELRIGGLFLEYNKLLASWLAGFIDF